LANDSLDSLLNTGKKAAMGDLRRLFLFIMASYHREIVCVFNELRQPSSFGWKGKWIRDSEWVEYMKARPGFLSLNTQALNRALWEDPELQSCLANQSK
jgi:hypothetical protein